MHDLTIVVIENADVSDQRSTCTYEAYRKVWKPRGFTSLGEFSGQAVQRGPLTVEEAAADEFAATGVPAQPGQPGPDVDPSTVDPLVVGQEPEDDSTEADPLAVGQDPEDSPSDFTPSGFADHQSEED